MALSRRQQMLKIAAEASLRAGAEKARRKLAEVDEEARLTMGQR